MKPAIGIVVCGFMNNRQFVTNPYIQSDPDISRGLPLHLPLVRSDHSARISTFPLCCRLSLLRRRRYHAAALWARNPGRETAETEHHCGPFPDSSHEARPGLPQTGTGHLPRDAGAQCSMRRNHLAGSVPDPRKQSINHMQQSPSRSDVSHRIRTEPGSLIRNICAGSTLLRQQFPSPGRQRPRARAYP